LDAEATGAREGGVVDVDNLAAVLANSDVVVVYYEKEFVPVVGLYGFFVAVFGDEGFAHAVEGTGEDTGVGRLIEKVDLIAGTRTGDAEPDAGVAGEAQTPFAGELEIGVEPFGEKIPFGATGTLAANEFTVFDEPSGVAFFPPAL
jgi:hypothetical protein